MKSLLLINISIVYGFLFGMVFLRIRKYYILQILSFLLFTLFYIFIMYKLNYGIINYILKLCLVGGFIIYCKINNKKCQINDFRKKSI
jgi:hypothetical protein